MPAEKTVQEFLTAPVLLLRRLFGEGASGTAGAEGRLPSGRPRPPSTRCAAPDAHAPKMLILLSKQFAAAVFDLKKKQGFPCFSDEKYYFPNAAAVTRFIFSTKAAASGIGLPSNRIAWSSSREAMSLCNSSEAFSNASRIG